MFVSMDKFYEHSDNYNLTSGREVKKNACTHLKRLWYGCVGVYNDSFMSLE